MTTATEAIETTSPITESAEPAVTHHPNAVQTLKGAFVPVKLHRHSLGTRRQLTDEQESLAASVFSAKGESLSGGKIIIDRKNPQYREVKRVQCRARNYWTCCSLPYPEDGIRLIRESKVEEFNSMMEMYQVELSEAVAAFDKVWPTLIATAEADMGELFNPLDYPSSVSGLFSIEWEFCNVHPPEHLKGMNPALFEKEKQRMMARFEEATAMAEQAFMEEFAKVVESLTSSLAKTEDKNGRPKAFQAKSIGPIKSFFDRFAELNVHSNEQLDKLVEQAKKLVSGIDVKDVKEDQGLRKNLASSFTGLNAQLDQMMVSRPKRKLIVDEE